MLELTLETSAQGRSVNFCLGPGDDGIAIRGDEFVEQLPPLSGGRTGRNHREQFLLGGAFDTVIGRANSVVRGQVFRDDLLHDFKRDSLEVRDGLPFCIVRL